MQIKKLFQLVAKTLKAYFSRKSFLVIFSAFLLLMLWGFHGNLELLKLVLPTWSAPGVDTTTRPPILPWIPWDRELIPFWGGALLLVLIPVLLILFVFKEPLRNYGLALPPKEKRKEGLFVFLLLVLVMAPAFYIGSLDQGMQNTYPFYKNFSSTGQFILYELSYFPFFLAIEFIFRGYLLFGLSSLKEPTDELNKPTSYFIGYSVAIQMLPYVIWHLGKPLPELWSTPIWGLVTGILTYYLRSIWPVTLAHWVLNILLDIFILKQFQLLF